MVQELTDEFVHGPPGLDHQHDPPRPFEHPDEFVHGMSAENLRSPGLAREKIVHLGDRTVEDRHRIAVIVHVQDQVLAHDRQPDESDIRLRFHVRNLLFVCDAAPYSSAKPARRLYSSRCRSIASPCRRLRSGSGS